MRLPRLSLSPVVRVEEEEEGKRNPPLAPTRDIFCLFCYNLKILNLVKPKKVDSEKGSFPPPFSSSLGSLLV